ncbi:hypothetical protein [Mycolicibacterium sp. XJ1819]
MLTAVRKVLDFEMTIAEWIGTAALLAAPYLVVGVLWTAVHFDEIGGQGVDRVVSILGTVVSWPVLLFSTVCMT